MTWKFVILYLTCKTGDEMNCSISNKVDDLYFQWCRREREHLAIIGSLQRASSGSGCRQGSTLPITSGTPSLNSLCVHIMLLGMVTCSN